MSDNAIDYEDEFVAIKIQCLTVHTNKKPNVFAVEIKVFAVKKIGVGSSSFIISFDMLNVNNKTTEYYEMLEFCNNEIGALDFLQSKAEKIITEEEL